MEWWKVFFCTFISLYSFTILPSITRFSISFKANDIKEVGALNYVNFSFFMLVAAPLYGPGFYFIKGKKNDIKEDNNEL